MSCEFCQGDEAIAENKDIQVFVSSDGDIDVFPERGLALRGRVNYCPMCGAPLGEAKVLTLEAVQGIAIGTPIYLRVFDYDGALQAKIWALYEGEFRNKLYNDSVFEFHALNPSHQCWIRPWWGRQYGSLWRAYIRPPKGDV